MSLSIQDLRCLVESRGRVNLFGLGIADERTALAEFDEALRRSGLVFEGRTLVVRPEPYIFDAKFDAKIVADIEALHAVVCRCTHIVMSDRALQDSMGISDQQRQTLFLGVEYEPVVFFCRFDFAFLPDGTPQIFEVNSECPGGLLLSRHIFDAFRGTAYNRLLSSMLSSPYLPQTGPVFSTAMANLFRRTRLTDLNPSIAVVNSKHKTLTNEIDLIVKELNAFGMQGISCFVEDLKYAGGQLLAKGLPVDMVYNKFDTGEENYELTFTRSAKDVKAYLKALTDGSVIVVNSFPSSYIPESKAFLALLSGNQTLRNMLTSYEIALIDRLVPWTRVLHLLSNEERADIIRNKADYVLKQAYDTRGRTVTVGATISCEDWMNFIDRACMSRKAFVVQRFVAPEALCLGDQCVSPMLTTHSYFVMDGKACCPFPRTARSNVTNVAQGGALVVPLRVEIG